MRKETIDAVCRYAGVPVCVIDGQGNIIASSEDIDEVFVYSKLEGINIYAITSAGYEKYLQAAEGEVKLPYFKTNDKVFRLDVEKLDGGPELVVYFHDRTNYEKLKKKFNDERVCMAIVHVDNYDELESVTADENKMKLDTDIDRCIRQWAAKIQASVTRYSDDMYFLVFEHQYYEWLKTDKFSVLDNVREIETEADFPVTLSMGIGLQGKSFHINDEWAQDGLNLALGRGGDQAVVKHGQKIEYYGGRTKAVEKSNKGKSRIIWYGFKQLAEAASNVIIMGHRYPDMDAFGASLGMHRLAREFAKDIYIVVNEYNDTLSEVYEQAMASEEYRIVNTEKALSVMNEDTLVVLLDTHRMMLVEAPEIIEKAESLVLIDHHRMAADAIEATLSYMEPYASSTCELVTEMLQFANAKKTISKLEAEALLGGISIDTNRFAMQTGVRTFEAASWLKRAGADTTAVKRFFRIDTDTFRLRAIAIANAVIDEHGIATAVQNIPHIDAAIIDAQVADELLTVKGVKASFVAGIDVSGRTVISARSLGEVNVQTVMETLGGGGHLTTAGAQVDLSPEESIDRIMEILEKMR